MTETKRILFITGKARRTRTCVAQGFTLLELFVVLLIVAILVVLTMPAVMAARDGARRVRCASHLKSLGIGLNSYAARYGCFPASTPARRSVFVALLPDIEQSELFDQYNFKVDSSAAPNSTVLRSRPSILICPAVARTSSSRFAECSTSYAVNLGSGSWTANPDGIVGTFGVAPSEVIDGLSKTAAFAEWIPADAAPHRKGGGVVFHIDASAFNEREAFVENCMAATLVSDYSINSLGKNWTDGFPYDTCYNHQIIPNLQSCSANLVPMSWMAQTASSHHQAVVGVVFCDGSVSFVGDEVDVAIWRNYGSRNGEEIGF